MDSKMTDFSDLSDKSQQLLNRVANQYHGVSNISRNIRDIGNASRELSEATSSKANAQYDVQMKAINKYNIDQKLISDNLNTLSTTTFTEVQPFHTDVNGYLNSTFEAITMQAIQDVQKSTRMEFKSNLERSAQNEWVADKKRLEETLGQRLVKVPRAQLSSSTINNPSSSLMIQSSSQLSSSTFNNNNNINRSLMISGGIDEKTRLSNKMRSYAVCIHQYLENVGYPLIENLMKAHLSETTQYRQVVEDAWILISTLSSSNDNNNNNRQQQLQQLQQKQIIKKSIQFLEQQFCNTMKSKLPTRSNVSSPLDEIISYVSSNVQKPSMDGQDETYQSCSIWSLIYYSIRAGYLEVAINLSSSLVKNKDLITSILDYKYKDEQCPNDLKNKLQQEYRNVRNESKDYYKIAVYNLLSCADCINVHSNKILFPFIQDLIWWRLHFVKEGAYALQSLQSALNDTLAQTPFDPYVLFQLQLLSAQFELAIVRLYEASNGCYSADALHMAIAFSRCGQLLRLPRPESTIVDASLSDLYDARFNTLNLVAMLRRYIKSFASETDTNEALDYYLLIDDKDIRSQCIADLIVTSTRDIQFANHLKGRIGSEDEWHGIIEQTALSYESKNNVQAAIDYWLLLNAYARVLDLFNGRFSQLLTSSSDEHRQLYQFGIQLSRARTLQVNFGGQYAFKTFSQLLLLASFFEQYHQARYQEALDALDAIGITPVRPQDVDKCADEYRFLSNHITRNFASIIQACIDIIEKLYEVQKANLPTQHQYIPSNAENQLFAGTLQQIEILQARAQTLSNFSLKIEFPMSGNILPKLMNFLISIKK